MKIIRVILAEPLPVVRAGVRLLIERCRGIQIIAEAGTGSELLDAVTADPPDIVVTELALPGVSGIDAARRLARHLPQVKILLLTGDVGSAQVAAALKAGVLGFVAKAGEPAELEIALNAVARGNPYLSPLLARHAIERRSSRLDDSVILSTRQREVLRLIGRGKSTKEIAALMGVSAKTVETHRARLMVSLELSNINALMHYAMRHELASGDAI